MRFPESARVDVRSIFIGTSYHAEPVLFSTVMMLGLRKVGGASVSERRGSLASGVSLTSTSFLPVQ